MRVLVALLLVLFSGTALAVAEGERIRAWTLEDQFGDDVLIAPDTRLLLVASSRKAADVANEALEALPEGFLESQAALYVADVSRMPKMITRMVMVPAMRSAHYRVLLDYDSRVAPERLGDDDVLWLGLEGLTVNERRTFDSAAALRQALEALPQ
ncbi:hypothetical protein [Billgrantia lactosivorans]|uniref:hypothetical protein n=1 Tax=Billgrantia lactosivorans TaxID=2185141 RepID=UPI000DABE8C5|nr:hypothetical protein [Halomonas lactosivorans]